MINVKKLTRELTKAGISSGGCNADGIVWGTDGTTEIQDVPAVIAVLAAHDPADDEGARKATAKTNAVAVSQFKDVTPAEAEQWIEDNVDDLASAKNALKLMAKMIIAMRDEIWPDLPEL